VIATPTPSAVAPTLDALSVVIPVYNERAWIGTAVLALLAAAAEADIRLDVVVVDDGSTDGTSDALDALSAETGIRVLHQANSGRLAARSAGLEQAREVWVLLLDARVVVEKDSLKWVRRHLTENPRHRVWCGHVDVETVGNPYAAFWSGLVKIGWRRYTADPRLVSLGPEEFDQYPKGTGCLLVERSVLAEAFAGFCSMYDDGHLASDDTRLLRDIVLRERIWLAPEFRFRYHGKTGARGFVRQAYFRGTTFVDGYLGQPGAVRRALLLALAAAGGLAVLSLRKPVVGLAGAAAGVAAVPAAVSWAGGSSAEVRSAALLAPVFVPVFGAGVLRGLVLTALARRPGGSRPT
jgi:hypothetical protein